MNQAGAGALAIAVGLAFSAGATAQSISKDQYRSGEDRITAEYKAAKAGCGSFSGNARDICHAQASGRESIATAELEARYKPSEDASYKMRVARAEADYGVARQRCDDSAGNVKDVCVQEAKAAAVAARADAKAQMKTADARNDAASDKRNADFAVAKEKCDAFAGDAKNNCVIDAKARFGKP
jgi:hypothetical protein